MANELQSLSQLFQNRLFRIPDYQRGYAWQRPQLVDFWDDLINLQQDRYHYTGLLSLKALNRKEAENWGDDLWMVEKGFKPCHIVDGQQRITTFIILLNEILEFIRGLDGNKGKHDGEIILGYETIKDIAAKYICQKRPPNWVVTTYLFGYEVDNPSAEYMRHKVFGEPYSGAVKETYYTKNLKFAKVFFKDNIQALYEKEGIDGLGDIYRKMTLRLMFNLHEIADDYDVFVAFETMNNRGKKLTNLELLKNRLIYLTTLYDDNKFDETDKNALRGKINDAWMEVYYQLGRNRNLLLSDDDFLRAHWIIYFMYSRKKGDDYIRFLLRKFSAKNIFEKQTILLEGDSGEQPMDDVDSDDIASEDAEVQDEETDEVSKLVPSEIADYVNSLKDMAQYWYDTYFPEESGHLTDAEKTWVERLNRIGIGYFRPLVAVIISRMDLSAKKRVKAFSAIERFLFVCFRIGGINGTYGSSDYYRAARSIYRKEMEVDDIIADMQQTVQYNTEYAIRQFTIKMEKYFSNGNGYYDWNSLRYFLFEYESSLAQKNNIDRFCSWSLFTKNEKDMVSIEHILPQTPTNHYWKNQFKQYNDDEIWILSGALGNLLPLSQNINSSLQNDSFPDKKSKKNGRRGYENGSHSEIEVSKIKNWTAKEIYNRSRRLLEFMQERWNIEISAQQMDKLIALPFVKNGRKNRRN